MVASSGQIVGILLLSSRKVKVPVDTLLHFNRLQYPVQEYAPEFFVLASRCSRAPNCSHRLVIRACCDEEGSNDHVLGHWYVSVQILDLREDVAEVLC